MSPYLQIKSGCVKIERTTFRVKKSTAEITLGLSMVENHLFKNATLQAKAAYLSKHRSRMCNDHFLHFHQICSGLSSSSTVLHSYTIHQNIHHRGRHGSLVKSQSHDSQHECE